MRNGFTKTLAAVAFACLAYQAMAVAPVVREIPSPVVTDDANPVTGSYLFVYADWINLNDYVIDDGDLANIVWSYAAASGRYRFNGARPLDLLSESPVTPPAAAVINSAANITATGEYNPDSNVLTPTVRDVVLSPFGGPNVPAGTTPGQILGTDTISLFASDGTTQSLPSVFVAYTQASGGVFNDRLSATPTPTPVNVASLNFASSTNGWTQGTPLGSATFGTTGGLCITVTAAGVNTGEWISPYNIIPLVDNSVWRLRATMSTTQNTAGLVPLWDVRVENLSTDSGGNIIAGDLAYIGDYYFLDNTGSANAIKGPAVGRNDFEIWYAPSAVRTPQWRSTTNGAFTTARDPNNDMRIVLRVLDVEGAGYGGELDAGTICLTNLVIDRFDLSKVYSTTTVYNLNPIVQGINGVSVEDGIGSGTGAGSIKNFTTNPLTITPADSAGWLVELTLIRPGDTNNPALNDPGYNGAAVVDNYPVTWEPNTLYEIQVVASAPDANSEVRGPDSLRIGFDTKTLELFADSYILTGLGGVGSPKTVATAGAPQTYSMFFWSHSATLSTVPEANRLRYRVDILNTDAYNRPLATDTRNTGGIRIHSIKMQKVVFYGM